MIDRIQLTTTAKYDDDAEMWIAKIPGYPVTGKGEGPDEAIMSARDEIQKFFLAVAGRRYVTVRHDFVSLKAELEIRIESDRGATLVEFGLGTGHEEQEESP